jgi:hypothetical protein
MAIRKYTEAEEKQRAVRRAAQVLYELWDEGHTAHSRILEYLVRDDHLLVRIGYSTNGGSAREHVVPLAYIRNECYAMFERGENVEAAAAFIDAHLKVAHITTEQRDKLDVELGLKTGMPRDWLRGDYLARITAAGIVLREKPTTT